MQLYFYNSINNNDFLNKYNNNDFLNNYNNTITNLDCKLSLNNYNELTTLFNNNNFISFRPGCVETSFILMYKFNFKVKDSHLNTNDENIDIYLKMNAGIYYKKNKQEVLDWYTQNFIELIYNSIYTSCLLFIYYDLPLLSLLDIKQTIYNYGDLYRVILENSENKKILYVGYNVDSIKKGYENGLQHVWNFKVTNFSMYYLKTPQTTLGMEYPDNSSIETCNNLINEIDKHYSDFDTAIFGCGCYGSSLINILRKKYNKNLIYLGSDCLKMFGIKINLQPWELYDVNVKKDMVIDIVETLPDGCKNYPEKKYWKI